MIYNLAYYFMLFFIFSFIGYLCEVISVSYHKKKICLNRGYLIGPYLPIFGFGSLLILLFLNDYKNDYLVLFVLGMCICLIVEYLTSYLLEMIFHIRWWDYSYKKFNVNGRIALDTGILFGIGSIVITIIVNKYLFGILDSIPKNVLIIISSLLAIIMLIDFAFSTFVIFRLKNQTFLLEHKDSTDEVRKEIFAVLARNRYFYKRFIDSFPHIKRNSSTINNINKFLIKIRKKDKYE